MRDREINLSIQIGCVFFAAVLTICVFEWTALDIQIARLAFDEAEKIFPYREEIFFAKYLHHGLKSLMYAAGLTGIGWAVYCYRKTQSQPLRQSCLVAIMGIILIPLSITAIKHVTSRHCPGQWIFWRQHTVYIYGLFERRLPWRAMLLGGSCLRRVYVDIVGDGILAYAADAG